MSEKYVNYYIETLTSTMTDAVVRNISLQTNNRINDEVIKELNRKIEDLSKKNEEYKVTFDNNNKIIGDLNSKVQNLDRLNKDYESMKTQNVVSNGNAESFRKKLIDECSSHQETKQNLEKECAAHQKTKENLEKTIDDLKQEIVLLKTPKRKKPVKDEPGLSEPEEQEIVSHDTIEDGGSF